jgi:anaerobic selenocysteine-containing dehydrogenase
VCDGLPEGRARFVPIAVRPTARPADAFVLTTRRGKQFNSMTQSTTDALTGTTGRDAVFMAAADARRLGLAEGAPLELVSEVGRYAGRCRIARVVPGTLQVYWPEGNVLIERRLDPASGEPDYNAVVRVAAPKPS